MAGSYELDALDFAVKRKLITFSEADHARKQAEKLGVSPLQILIEEGKIPVDAAVSLCDGARPNGNRNGHPPFDNYEPKPVVSPIRDPEKSGDTLIMDSGIGSGSDWSATPAQSEGLDFEPRDDGFPKDWERYQLIRFLGEGGMGQVFLAYDPKLNRQVAIKFVRGDDPNLVQRLMNEARAQAKVEHERLCKVYEVGEVRGRAYISMQYVEGVPLNDAAQEMSLEQKLIAIKEVAEAVHEAHRNGLIHRDLKPSNILMEKQRDGGWKPFVMDFGLAREMMSPGLTRTGVVIGTPHYMPPEQARGEIHQLDRRSDVYGMGAALYELLAGAPPFRGETSVNVLFQVMNEDPKKLRSINPSIPEDVETIVLKCLEKEQNRRYESARALAEDIDRYLNGDPILARQASIVYRLRKRARKNLMAVILGSVAVVALSGSLTWVILEKFRNQERLALNLEFDHEADTIENLVRLTHSIPVHDIKEERQKLRDRIVHIESLMAENGVMARGPGHSALGRGYLALGEYEKAHDHLEKAWNAGYQDSEVAYALGLTYGYLYQKALRRIENSEEAETYRSEIEQKYRTKALFYMQKVSESDALSPEYVEALLAFYDKRHQDALTKAKAAFESLPWLYEAKLLEGDIYVAMGEIHRNIGNEDQALADLNQAEEAYKSAMSVGQSDPLVYTKLGGLALSWMVFGLVGNVKVDFEYQYEYGIAYCAQALTIDPEYADGFLTQSGLHKRMGEYRRKSDKDPTPSLNQAIQSAHRAMELAPGNAEVYDRLGAALYERGSYKRRTNVDPSEDFIAGADAMNRALELDLESNYGVYNRLGLIRLGQARFEDGHGDNSLRFYELAVKAFENATRSDPGIAGAHSNLGNAFYGIGQFEMKRGIDSRESFRRAIQAHERAIEINPTFVNALTNVGIDYVAMAEFKYSQGLTETSDLEKAIGFLERSRAEKTPNRTVLNAAGDAYRFRAMFEWDQGEDPNESLSLAKAEYVAASETSPNSYSPWGNLGITHTAWARFANEANRDPSLHLKAAEEAFDRAFSLLDKDPQLLSYYADLEIAKAQIDYRKRPEAARRSIGEGLEVLERSVALDSEYYFTHRLLGEILSLQALLSESVEESRALLQKSKHAFAEARRLQGRDPRTLIAMAEDVWRRAQKERDLGGDPSGILSEGIILIDDFHGKNPQQAKLLAFKGAMMLMRDRASTEGRDLLSQALEANRNLIPRFQPILEK